MTCDLVTNRFLELSYEECLLFPHESTAPMIYSLTFKNNLLSSKYLFPTSGKLISTSWAISSITLYQITAFSTSREFLVTSSREITCDLVSNRFLELSLMSNVCSSHINLLLLWYIFLPLEITYEIPRLGKSIKTARVTGYFHYVSLLITLSISA